MKQNIAQQTLKRVRPFITPPTVITQYVTPAPFNSLVPYTKFQSTDQVLVQGNYGPLMLGSPTSPQIVTRQRIDDKNTWPYANYWYQFDTWFVAGGVDFDGNPVGIYSVDEPGDPIAAPIVYAGSDNIIESAIFDLDGGDVDANGNPIPDQPAVRLDAFDDQHGPIRPRPAFFRVGDGLNQGRQAQANGASSEVITDADVTTIEALSFGRYEFRRWRVDGVFLDPGKTIISVTKGQGGWAKAYYHSWDIAVHAPPPLRFKRQPTLPDDRAGATLQQRVELAATMVNLTGGLAPELQSTARELAYKQAAIATASFKKEMISLNKKADIAKKSQTRKRAAR